jgi:hypothetical protein
MVSTSWGEDEFVALRSEQREQIQDLLGCQPGFQPRYILSTEASYVGDVLLP